MNNQEKERIDKITETVYYLLKGKAPEPINLDNAPDDEISQLSGMVNKLTQQFKETKETIVPLSLGNLDITIPRQNFLASPFKQLQSSLHHLSWQTKQIASGDYSQRVDFMGDFSEAFNTMVSALDENRAQLLSDVDKFKDMAEQQKQYLNIMAHDIRTPIGAIIGFANILLERDIDQKTREILQTIKRNCDSLLALINNLLDMAKLEKQKMELARVPFFIKTLAQDVEAMIQGTLKANVEFILDFNQNIPSKIKGDPHRLRQILINLIGNAAKFTTKGRISLIIDIMEETEESLNIKFSVADTGIGIPKDKLPGIFTPFKQVDSSIASRFGGTGLGLAISHELVSLMGGKLEVESEEGKGTTFYFSVDFGRATKDEFEEYGKSYYKNIRILVVDDNQDDLQIMEHILTKEGVRFSLINSGPKAYPAIIKAMVEKDPYSLVCIDIDMPELNGFELAELLRDDPKLDNTRIITCTSFIDQVSEYDKPNYFSFVAVKPLSTEALERILDEANTGFAKKEKECILKDLKLLLVDDNSTNRMIVKHVFKHKGIVVTDVENGQLGIEAVENEDYDLVLMDQMMPVLDGIKATMKIRETNKDIPILAFTADDDEETKEEFFNAGVNGIVMKPLNIDNAIDEICKVI